MAEIIDPSQDFNSPYHVSSQQHTIFALWYTTRETIFL